MVDFTQLGNELREHVSQLRRGPLSASAVNVGVNRVSVIIPSFNQGRFLERTILSVLNQDWPDVELIIVDGASQDNSVEVIRKYEPYLSWWVSEKDSGQTQAIVKGISHATGTYITWLGSDDILMPGALRRMAGALDLHPHACMVYGGVAFIDSADRVMKVTSYRDMSLNALLYHKHSTIAQPSSLLRRSALDAAGGLDESLHYCMDYDLWVRLHSLAPSVNLGDVIISCYRLHESSKTVGAYTRMALEKITVNRRHTGNLLNKVIYAHYWYIIEGRIRALRRGGRR